MNATMELDVHTALHGLLSRYLTIRSSASTDTNDSALFIAEDIVSIASKWLQDMRQRWNQTTPMYRLPPEILLSIFQLCVSTQGFHFDEKKSCQYDPSLPTDRYYVDLLRLCGVSSDWARIIRDTPEFWVFTRSWAHPRLTDLILERSQTLPLWVEYVTEHMDGPHHIENLTKYVDTICKESHRWHALILRLSDTRFSLIPHLQQLGAETCPQLSQLFIHGNNRTVPLSYFFKSGQPPLKYFRVMEMEMDWSGWRLSGLEVVRLVGKRNANPRKFTISYSQLLSLIKNSPSLKTLELDTVYISNPPHNRFPTALSSSIPVLDNLALCGVEPAWVIPLLLPHVALHHSSKLSTVVDIYGAHTTLGTQDAIRIVASLSQFLFPLARPTYPTTLSITTRYGDRVMFSLDYHGDGACDVTFLDDAEGRPRIDQLVLALSPELCRMPTHLKLCLESPRDTLVAILTDHVNVVAMDLLVSDQRNKFTVHSLCRPSPSPLSNWLFPRLIRLNLQFESVNHSYKRASGVKPKMLEALCQFAEARSILAGVGTPGVMEIESITLSGVGDIHPLDIERLEALVPDLRIEV